MSSLEDQATFGKKFEVDNGNINVLVGQILTIIDATYQNLEQREAAKKLFRRAIWGWASVQRGENQAEVAWAGSPEMI